MAHPPIISEEDFLRAYDLYADGIFRHCHLRIADRERSKNLMSQAFRNLWEYIADGNVVDSVKIFLYREINQLIEASKREACLPQHESIVEIFGETVSALHRLPKDQRRLCILRNIDDLSFEDISKVIGGSVKKHLQMFVQVEERLLSLLPQHG